MCRKILWNKFVFWALFFLLIQQLIVASSTFWIAHLSKAIVSGRNILLYLGLFVSSLFLVYIPGVFSAYNFEKAKSKAIFKYTQQFSETHKCIPTALAEKDFQGEREPWLTNESNKTIEETFHMMYDSASTGLNTILSIGAVCLAIDHRMLFGYLISFIILPITSKFFKAKLAQVGLTLQNDRKDLSQILLSGWDNIIIGNIYNFTIWWKQYTIRWNAYNKSSANIVLFTQISSTCAMILSLIPIAATFLWIFLTTNNTSKLASLIATLPRQIQIIQHFEILSTYAMYWHGTYAKLKALLVTLILPKDYVNQYLDRIVENEILFHVNKKQVNFPSIKHFIETLMKMKSGRITIRGKNGSGKTTLINLLKRELGDKAYYLPTNTRLLFETTIDNSFSTGQRMKACFEELEKNLLHDKILLLDEWDANLDEKNTQIISDMLDTFSKKCCVVEISHRQNVVNTYDINLSLEATNIVTP